MDTSHANRWKHFSDKEMHQVYLALAAWSPDKMHSQGMIDEIVVEANRRGTERAEQIVG